MEHPALLRTQPVFVDIVGGGDGGGAECGGGKWNHESSYNANNATHDTIAISCGYSSNVHIINEP